MARKQKEAYVEVVQFTDKTIAEFIQLSEASKFLVSRYENICKKIEMLGASHQLLINCLESKGMIDEEFKYHYLRSVHGYAIPEASVEVIEHNRILVLIKSLSKYYSDNLKGFTQRAVINKFKNIDFFKDLILKGYSLQSIQKQLQLPDAVFQYGVEFIFKIYDIGPERLENKTKLTPDLLVQHLKEAYPAYFKLDLSDMLKDAKQGDLKENKNG